MNVRVLRGCVLVAIAMSGLAAAQERPDRSRPPSPGLPAALDLPAIQKLSLTNGLGVWVVERHEVPIVQVSLIVRAGAGLDPAGKFGAATLTAAMLDEGAGARSALDIADVAEFLGASLTTTASFDAAAVRLNVPVEHLPEALPLLADVALRPAFPDKELERLRQERLTLLLQARDEPSSLAGMAFSRLVFGPAHRYGTGTIGTNASLKSLSAADLRGFHSAHYEPSGATVLVVGDTTAAAIVPLLQRAFGDWRRAPSPRPDPPAPVPPPRGEVVIVDTPGAEQSQIRIGTVGVSRSAPDYFPLLVLNTILGGSFTSRLNQNLREEHGYTYGASSAFDMRRSAGPFVAAAGVQTDKTADALREFFTELNGIRQPVGAEELAKAKNYVALAFPGEFETTTDLSRRLEELVAYGLPDDYFERYVPNVTAVTAAAVQRAAAQHLQPSRFTVVVVGDRKAIEPGIRALKLGPVRAVAVTEALGE